MSVRVSLSPLIYSKECLENAVAAYSDICSVVALGNTPAGPQIEIKAAPGIGDEPRLVREFLNYVLDLSLEKHLGRR